MHILFIYIFYLQYKIHTIITTFLKKGNFAGGGLICSAKLLEKQKLLGKWTWRKKIWPLYLTPSSTQTCEKWEDLLQISQHRLSIGKTHFSRFSKLIVTIATVIKYNLKVKIEVCFDIIKDWFVIYLNVFLLYFCLIANHDQIALSVIYCLLFIAHCSLNYVHHLMSSHY